jgi:hypothetical protein
VFSKNSNFLLLKIIFYCVLDRFDALILKNIYIILMHFSKKNILKNNHNHIPKQTLQNAMLASNGKNQYFTRHIYNLQQGTKSQECVSLEGYRAAQCIS